MCYIKFVVMKNITICSMKRLCIEIVVIKKIIKEIFVLRSMIFIKPAVIYSGMVMVLKIYFDYQIIYRNLNTDIYLIF